MALTAVCNRVILLKKGKIVADKQLSEIQINKEQIIEVQFDFKIEPQFLNRLDAITKVVNVYENVWELHFLTEEDMRPKVFDFAQKAAGQLRGVEGLSGINLSMDMTKPEYRIHVNRAKASALGISVKTVAETLQSL